MNDLRTAAQQALEALTAHADLHGTMYLKMDAITALRAALAEPVQEPVAVVGGQRKGWFYLTGRPNVKTGDKLYTAPPQRKPLTEEEIAEASAGVLGLPHEIKVELARAIEQAHGIGEKE